MVTIYTCPCCGSEMHSDEAAQKLKCDTCGVSCEVDEFISQTPEQFLEAVHGTQTDEECDGYICNNCGAQMITENNSSSTFCSFCGAPAVTPARIAGAAVPELIMPFMIDKKAAQRAFVSWFGKRPLVPGGFAETAMAGRISGLYVPFWVYDCEVETRLHAKSSTTATDTVGDTQHVTAGHYSHYREIVSGCAGVPADASKRMDGRLMNLLEPFDYSLLTDFDPKYLSGFCAEKYSLTYEQLAPHIKKRVDEYAGKAALSTLDSSAGVPSVTSCEHFYTKCRAKYALLPVWTMNYTINNYTHQFFMNGQTGKIVGSPPVSLRRAASLFFGIAGGIALLGEIICLAVNYI